jgi:hypothetical protein
MISLTHNTSPADTNGVFSLLALLTDPKAAGARLQELFAAKQEFDKTVEKAQAAQDEAKKHVEVAALREKALIAREEQISKREQAVRDRENGVNGRDNAVAALEKELARKKAEHEVREANVQSLEKAAALKTAKTEQDAKAAAELKADFEKRIAQLKQIAS